MVGMCAGFAVVALRIEFQYCDELTMFKTDDRLLLLLLLFSKII